MSASVPGANAAILGNVRLDSWAAVGMLMYLAGNAHPEIQYAVHQCARFTHAPRQSHAVAVKSIAHYLQGVLNKEAGLCYKITEDLNFDMYCDVDFARLWTYENGQDLVCATISLRSALMSNLLMPQIHDHNDYPNESHSDTTCVRWVATIARRTKMDARLNCTTSPAV